MIVLIVFGVVVTLFLVWMVALVSLGAEAVLVRGDERSGHLGYTKIAWVIIALSFIGAALGILPFG